MARIAGVELPGNKRIEVALTYILGIGRSTSLKILGEVGISPDIRTKDLKEEQINKLQEEITKNYKVEGDLRRKVSAEIKRLIDIKSYRGERHKKGLPVHGQRTRTNARTRKGPRKIIGRKGK